MIYLFDLASGNIDVCLCEEDMADKRRICSCSSEFPFRRCWWFTCSCPSLWKSPASFGSYKLSRCKHRLGENQGCDTELLMTPQPQVFEDVRRFRIQVSVISPWKYLNPVDQMSLDEHLVRPTGNNIWRVGIGCIIASSNQFLNS